MVEDRVAGERLKCGSGGEGKNKVDTEVDGRGLEA